MTAMPGLVFRMVTTRLVHRSTPLVNKAMPTMNVVIAIAGPTTRSKVQVVNAKTQRYQYQDDG